MNPSKRKENLQQNYHLLSVLYKQQKGNKTILEEIFSRELQIYQLEIQGLKNSLQSRNAVLTVLGLVLNHFFFQLPGQD